MRYLLLQQQCYIVLQCVILISLYSIALPVNAQIKALPDSNATWTTSFTDSPPNGTWYGSESIIGDSIVNGTRYVAVGREGPWGFHSGLYRTQGDSVFAISPDSLEEGLLYDFSLNAGDTFFVDHKIEYGQFGQEYAVVYASDSVQLLSGEWVKRLEFEATYWIYGVGATYGELFSPWYLHSVSGDIRLVCLALDSMMLYGDERDDNCQGVLQSIYSPEPTTISVFPNPSQLGSFTITTDLPVTQLQVYDIAGGQPIWREWASATAYHVELDEGTAPGIYYLIARIGGELVQAKLVKL